MNKTDELFRQFLIRLATKQACDLVSAARQLVEHEWGEVSDRDAFYPALREVLLRDPLDVTAIHDCAKSKGTTILGGHAVFRSRVKDFLASDAAGDALKDLVGDGTSPPPKETIDHFIQTVVENGFQTQQGKPAGAGAAYFTSVLLTAVFPGEFVGCRLTRWDWMARQFDLPRQSDESTYAARIETASRGARELSETQSFQKVFPSHKPLWTLGGLAFLLHRNDELKELVEDKAQTAAIDDTVTKAFQRFRESRNVQFAVRLRRHRAKELRNLLNDPFSIDLNTFNRDVWVVWTTATLNDEDVLSLLHPDANPSDEQLDTLESGLRENKLEVHGNCMWGSATRIYGPMLPGGDEERLRNVRQALEILNDDDLEPINKAKQITEISGFGNNIATGLVMVFHPNEFAIWNSPSGSAISKLGFHAADLESFQNVVSDIRKGLGADDFLELDYFFYLLDQGHLEFAAKQPAWWVCQGTMYKHERKNGYIFAAKETADGKVVQHHANLALMQPGQTVLHYAGKALQAIGTVKAIAEERNRPDNMPGEDPERLGYYVPVQYRELDNPIAIDEIPLAWRTDGEQPFTKMGKVKQGYSYPVSHAFVTKLNEQFGDRLPGDLPKPSEGKRVFKIAPGEGAKYWDECLKQGFICIGWGDVGDLRQFGSKEEFRKQFAECFGETYNNHEPTISRKANEVWTLRELKPGDVVVANQGMSHVLAIGEVLEPPYEFQPDPSREEYSHLIRVRWDTSVAKDIPKQGFWAMTTVADVPADLYEFILGQEEVPAETKVSLKDYVEPSFEELHKRIAAKGLSISERMIRRYHLSLKTRGFVILCGLSGSGKTWLAELYANAVGAEKELVPVAPNWTTNEDLIGYFNPMDGHYHDTRFSRFLRCAAEHYEEAQAAGVVARPFHLILDEMNLARVEYYFAKFLSAMEQRSRSVDARVDLGGAEHVSLPPNLFFVGTVNVDETTHGFADKVYDRAQLLEVTVDRDALKAHLGEVPYSDILMRIWDVVGDVTPFAFRVLDEVKSYVEESSKVGVSWKNAVDEQLLQKVLTKIKGAEQRVEKALEQFLECSVDQFPLSHSKAERMLEMLRHHGITSYF